MLCIVNTDTMLNLIEVPVTSQESERPCIYV